MAVLCKSLEYSYLVTIKLQVQILQTSDEVGIMATHGSIGEFSADNETWVSYVERIQQYFVVNDIKTDNKQRAVLLSFCGPSTYQLIRSVVSPAKPTKKKFHKIVQLMNEYYFPRLSVMMQHFSFNSRSRKRGKSVATFVADLRRLSEHCDFCKSLGEMLCDRLICGINDDRMQRRLLAESGLTFKKVYELRSTSHGDSGPRRKRTPRTTTYCSKQAQQSSYGSYQKITSHGCKDCRSSEPTK